MSTQNDSLKQKSPTGSAGEISETPAEERLQSDCTQFPGLMQHHVKMLKDSAISDEVIRERGYRTILDAGELQEFGFSPAQCRAPGLLLPLHGTNGDNPLCVYRPDNPRTHDDKRHHNTDGTYRQKIIKYEMPKGQKMRLDCPPRCRADLGNPGKPLWITEGQKKADALASNNLCAIALLGVWNFVGKNEHGGKVFLPDFLEIAFNGRNVNIVFDSDVMTKPEVRLALDTLTERLQRRGAIVSAVYLTPGQGGKIGVDDWFAEGHTADDLYNLVEAPRPNPKAAPPIVELLDEAPLAIRRPLCLVDGRAYAAIWPHVKKSVSQKMVNGQVVQLREPEIVKEQILHIVRDDGNVFGPWQVDFPISKLGIDVFLSNPPQARDSLWSTPGIRAYVERSYRADPLAVFKRVKSVISRFIDFERSLADQETMSEMLACFAISTWFLDVFPVSPYIWANGERGSGKTSLLLILVRLSYLGVSLSPSGSSAAIRDLADYGATLGLDDAEDLTDPKKSDPDKRAILLSGNRKGVTVHLKTENPNGPGWVTREVNTFCPRIFSTIQKPDPTLSSRAVIVPVVRTAQRNKGNSDPLDDLQWPCNRQELIDDLWAMSLENLAKMQAFDKLVAEKSKLIGRDLQPWRAILSVAAWLDSLGAKGLWPKIESLASGTYQEERLDLEKIDLNRLIIRAIGVHAERLPDNLQWSFYTQNIVDVIHRLIDDEEIEQDKDYIKTQVIGHRLKKMRLEKDDYVRPRGWRINRSALITLHEAYRVKLPEKIAQNFDDSVLGHIGNIGEIGDIGVNVTNDSNVTNVNTGESVEKMQICPACKGSTWWVRFDGALLCNTCHPKPSK